jgi:hypothetical protein
MKTNIGLNDEARLEVGSRLNLLLADEHEKAAWMLRAQLEFDEQEFSQYQPLKIQPTTL